MIIFTVLAVLFVLSLRKTAQKSQTASKNVALLEEKINQLSGQVEAERQAIEYASSDLAKEKILRNELLLQKPGEYVLQIPDDGALVVEAVTAEQSTPWDQWRELLF
jgi:outer membrane murein-binding lipoprotein Lpp